MDEPDWEKLVDELEKIRAPQPLRVEWSAYVGSEDYGIWLWIPGGPEECRASFGLFAARAIQMFGIPPIPAPRWEQHCPHWKQYHKLQKRLAKKQGQKLVESADLRTFERDSVDPCTRAWLELLRRVNRACVIVSQGTHTIRGASYATVTGIVNDLVGFSRAYLKRRALDEIGRRLEEGAWKPSTPPSRSRPSPRELVDAARTRLKCSSNDKFAAQVGVGRDTLFAIIGETRWVKGDSYRLVAAACGCKPEDLHPRNIPIPRRRRV